MGIDTHVYTKGIHAYIWEILRKTDFILNWKTNRTIIVC